ncbi:polyamine ABC transporter ATP-binding protein [Kaistia algarum]|uniref:ABC transporter ATP-binding protein n=1 Tax=Kaistia algarum TaxID=2083279 RepID=UPI000CE8C480|nr:ABC transporter ATP-binding protein [Kaistia algarum]MCX5512734.1 ABC transporter ATP-binding protein [Kaistia algarum]PPE82038.1 polyamine ABC transporter ATP-binding protein [Kaistia algarum]
MAFLDIRRLRKSYGLAVALDGVDLSVEEGEFITLLGPSGSGKTTLLMSIAGFIKPDGGGIVLSGTDVTDLDPEDRNFGLVFQGYALFPHLTVRDNVAFPLKVRKWQKRAIAERVDQMLALVGLDQLAARKPRELSGGQQQRVALARALAYSPRLLLLDEPLSALDRSLRGTMQRELKRLHRETGVTFIFVTHDQEEAYAMSDRIAVFQNGRIVQIGAPREIYRHPASRFVAGFIGGNNLIRARFSSETGTLSLLGREIPAPPHFDPASHSRDGEVSAWIRSEDIAIGGGEGHHQTFEVTVVDRAFHGAGDRITVKAAEGEELALFLADGSADAVAIGAPLQCRVRPDQIGFLFPD